MPTRPLSITRDLVKTLTLPPQTELTSTTAPSSTRRRWSTSSSAPCPAGGFIHSLFFPVKMKRRQPGGLCESQHLPSPLKVQVVPAAHLPRRPFKHVQLQEHLLLRDCSCVQGNSTPRTELYLGAPRALTIFAPSRPAG